MKKYIVMIIILSVHLNAQPVWNLQNAGTIASFTKIQMFDSLNGIMSGYNTAFYVTTNGGLNWTGSSFTAKLDYCKMQFVNSTTGYVMAINDFNYYEFLKTTNRGDNWTQPYISGLGLATAFYFKDVNKGWIGNAMGDIFYTQDGINWNMLSNVGIGITSFYFKDLSVGFAGCGLQSLFLTTNSGSNWINKYSGGLGKIYDIEFPSEEIGFACGSKGKILKTTDGGMNWVPINTNCIFELTSIKFINENTGWAVGTYGTILYSTNGGGSWQRYNNVTNLVYHSLQIVGNKAWICGEFGIILKCENILDN
jgi:photosystem II stability/assembly factor-like uncharacterized protein